ncbi:hypothetical protein K378_01646 [Streptomyces sp. Amel2xB2]|nr:hypothetical protein K378_01646 [Streptomyces sp. Amel2xB2]
MRGSTAGGQRLPVATPLAGIPRPDLSAVTLYAVARRYVDQMSVKSSLC